MNTAWLKLSHNLKPQIKKMESSPNWRLYCTLYCRRYYCYSFRFSFLSHSFIACRSPSLSLARSHLTHRPIPKKRGYATLTTMAAADADAGCPSTELEPPPLSLKSPVWKYLGFPGSYVDNVRVAETRWQVTLFPLTRDISYCYIMLLINVLNLTM